jgi:hypothetical protein
LECVIIASRKSVPTADRLGHPEGSSAGGRKSYFSRLSIRLTVTVGKKIMEEVSGLSLASLTSPLARSQPRHEDAVDFDAFLIPSQEYGK